MDLAKLRTAGSTTLSSFEEETRQLLRRRLIILFTTGILASIIAFSSALYLYDKRTLLPASRFAPWMDEIYLLHPISVALGLLTVLFLGNTIRRLQVVDYLVLKFNILIVIFSFAVFSPKDIPDLHLAMILIVHAAFIPSPVVYQVGLVVTALVAYPLAELLAFTFMPEVSDFWSSHGGDQTLRDVLLLGTLEALLYGFMSVQINKTLYNMRKKLHQAQRLGNYVIQGEVGSGGMGKVFLADHALMCRPTAIKVLQTEGQDPSALARFEREVRLSSTLTHPNTITIFDYGRADGNTFYYAMEYLEGLDLQQLVEKFGPLPPARAVSILLQVCGSLAEAHARGIVHRDIKPSNIFITCRGDLYDFVKVLDFGLAKQVAAGEVTGLTRSGAFFGTPRYIAPEAVDGMERLDARSDLYNLGGVAYWILTGQPPFSSPSDLQLIVDHVKTPPTPPSRISEMPLPAELDRIVLKCLEKRPEDRFQTATELAEALREVHSDAEWTPEKARAWWELHRPSTAGPSESRSAPSVLHPQKGVSGSTS